MSIIGRSNYSLGWKSAGSQMELGVKSVTEQLRAAGYKGDELAAVAKSIGEADAGNYVSREERLARREMMAEKGRFVSRAEYLASKLPQP
jgi:hypothetical protein